MAEYLVTPKRSLLTVIFLSSDESRLRAGWRLVIFIITLAVLSMISAPAAALQGRLNEDVWILLNQFLSLVMITTAVFFTRHFVDRQPIVSLGLKRDKQAVNDFLIGILVAFLMFGLIFTIELSLGWLKIEGFSWQVESAGTFVTGLLLWLAIFLVVGWQEELLSRGYILQNLTSGLNLFWGVLISSSIFAVMHRGNPGATWTSTLGILLAGASLALPYLLTRQLWMSIGLHIGWNFFEGVVFGFPVSGNSTFRIIHQTVSGSDLMTGGSFGPEGGLVLIPAVALSALLVWAYVRFSRKQSTIK